MEIPRKDLEFFAKKLIKYMMEEALKDAQKSNKIPKKGDFYKSISYVLTQDGVVITCDWDWAAALPKSLKKEGKIFNKSGLPTRDAVRSIPLRDSNGDVDMRPVPITTKDNVWIHHRIADSSFVQRAVDRAATEMVGNFGGSYVADTVLEIFRADGDDTMSR